MFEVAKVNDVFADFYKQLDEAKKVNEQTVFQYETPAGNKAARSHIYKLRKSKSAVEAKRKNAKEDSLKFGKALDSEAKKITADIEEMISIHDAPLKEIEERETVRVNKILFTIDKIKLAGLNEFNNYDALSSAEMQIVYNDVFNTSIDKFFAEFLANAIGAKESSLKRLSEKVAELKKSEDETAELEKLRRKNIEREQKEHDERVAREAKAEAEREAQEKAMRKEFEVKAEKERIEREKKEAIERAENEKQQAIDSAERAKREQIAQEERAKLEAEQALERERIAVERAKRAEIDRQNTEKQLIAAEQLKREANKRHIGNIRRDAKESIIELGISEKIAKELVMAIHNKQIANIKIQY